MEAFKQFAERARQRAEEVVLNAETTPLGADIDALCEYADKVEEHLAKLLEAINQYLHQLPVSSQVSSTQPSITEQLCHTFAMTSRVIGDRFGDALLKMAQTTVRVGEAGRQLDQTVAKQKLIPPMKQILENDIKYIKRQRETLQTKRLDLDVVKSRLRRASTQEEKRAIQPDLQRVQDAFDKQQSSVRSVLKLLQSKVDQLKKGLIEFEEARSQFYATCQQHLEQLKRQLPRKSSPEDSVASAASAIKHDPASKPATEATSSKIIVSTTSAMKRDLAQKAPKMTTSTLSTKKRDTERPRRPPSAGTSSAMTHSMGQSQYGSTFPDALIRKLLKTDFNRFPGEVSLHEIAQLCDAATAVFSRQPSLAEIQPPVIVCGDIHGQFTDLLRIFGALGHPPQKKYLFLGDYVDRGPQSVETIMLLFCYKVKFPDNFVLLRGNHECSNINSMYGFKTELDARFPHDSQDLFDRFNNAFAWMPMAGLIGNKILCMHGGISDKLTNMQQLRELRRPQTQPESPSLEIDLLWADPSPDIQGVQPNARGAGVIFGEDVVIRVCQLLGISCIIRAHQFIQSGFEPFANHRLITLFSAPAYTNQQNTGAAMSLGADLRYDVHYFPPV